MHLYGLKTKGKEGKQREKARSSGGNRGFFILFYWVEFISKFKPLQNAALQSIIKQVILLQEVIKMNYRND